MIRLARHALRHPHLWLVTLGVATIALGGGMTRLRLRTDGGALRPPHHPVVVATAEDRVRFQDPRQVVLLVSAPKGGPSLETPEGFRLLRELHRELRALPAVRADALFSLASLPRLQEGPGGFSLGTYLDDIPDDPGAFGDLVRELRSLTLTDGMLLSRDGRQAAFYVPLSEGSDDVPRQVESIEAWARQADAGPFVLRLTGPQVAETTLGDMVFRDLRVLIPVMVGVIALLLLVTLRTIAGMLIPLSEALLVLVWTLGTMGWTGMPITLVTTILPVVLMAMCITDEIHLLERVQSHLRSERPVPRGSAAPAAGRAAVHDSIERALGEVGRPIIATSVTTALGFLSFLSATMVPVRTFGLFAALGILLAMMLSFTGIPALLVCLPSRWLAPLRPRAASRAGRTTSPAPTRAEPARPDPLGRWALRRPGLALGIGLVLVLASVPGVLRLEVQDAWMDNFSPRAPLVTAERDFNAAFWGSYRYDVVLEGEDDLFYRPEGARWMEEVERIARSGPYVGGVITYLDPLGEVAASLGEDVPLSSLDPLRLADVATVAEMSENRLWLRQLLVESGRAARARIFVNSPDYEKARELETYLEPRLASLAQEAGLRWHASGDLPVAVVVVGSIVRNQLRSIGWTLLTVTAVLLLFFARGRGAWIALVPVAATVVVLLGAMGYAGMPLGIATSMFASLTVGVGVDFGLHYLHRYRRERAAGLDPVAASAATVGKTGRAVLWNAIVLALGFLVLTGSSLKPNHSLGLLLAAAIGVCYVTTLLFLPRLLRLLVLALLLGALPGLRAVPIARAATEAPCPRASDPAARAVMAGLEAGFRESARIVRMSIATKYGASHGLSRYFQDRTDDKVLWGVFNGDPDQTWLLYVFSGPGRLAGTTLLMKDLADPDLPDSMWLYLRSFDRLTALDQRSYRVMVPGTALTYEDSRGFIPLDKFDFHVVDLPPASGAEQTAPRDMEIVGCPRTPELRENLGYDSLLLRVDLSKHLVRRAEYYDLGGSLLKTYTADRDTLVEDRWFPAAVTLQHHTQGFETRIHYEYWLCDVPPDPATFRPDVEHETFLQRLRAVAVQTGLGERIDAEIAASEEQIRRYEEKWHGRKASGDPDRSDDPR